MNNVYVIKDGDTDADIPHMGCIHLHAHIGYCDLCACYRRVTKGWSSQQGAAGHNYACERHTPIDLALWIKEYWGED